MPAQRSPINARVLQTARHTVAAEAMSVQLFMLRCVSPVQSLGLDTSAVSGLKVEVKGTTSAASEAENGSIDHGSAIVPYDENMPAKLEDAAGPAHIPEETAGEGPSPMEITLSTAKVGIYTCKATDRARHGSCWQFALRFPLRNVPCIVMTTDVTSPQLAAVEMHTVRHGMLRPKQLAPPLLIRQ